MKGGEALKLNELKNKDFLEFWSELSEPIETATGFVPIISQIATVIKQRNINKRLIKHEEKINKIWISANNSASREFFTMKLTPIVFEKMINEHEDDKIDYILNGYENCVKNEITDLDKILFYFDILSDLRLLELKRLISHCHLVNIEPVKIEENSEEAIIVKSIDGKLHREDLVGFPEFLGGVDFSKPAVLSKKGEFLLKFINRE